MFFSLIALYTNTLYNTANGLEIKETVNQPLEHIGDQFKSRRQALLIRWCERVRADPSLPEQRLSFSDEDLEDHLPALLDTIIGALRGPHPGNGAIRERGAQHGHTRRLNGYSLEQVIWEFAIFRRLLREMLEQVATRDSREDLFAARELILEIADRSEIGSIHQYLEETSQERDQAREAFREANEQKDRFLAVLSHELRNPLAAMQAAIHIFKATSYSEAQKRRAFEIIDRQTEYQRRLVDDLLDVNRISQGRIQLKKEQIDLRTPIKGAIETFLPAIEAKGIKFQFRGADRAVVALADPVRIEQIVSNLLNNALKFTRPEGSIEIDLSQGGEVATISVGDTGAGIEPAEIDRIFDLFAQAAGAPSEGGVGIGLWLAKQLVGMHGGRIDVYSEGSGKGARFCVRLSCEALIDKADTTKKRVLFVEDDPDQREIMQIALSETGAEICVAKDGAEALTLASHSHFDVLLLDLSLPDISGYELLQGLEGLVRAQNERRPIFIALTGFGRPEDELKIKAAGFNHHVIKPASIEALQKIILTAEP